MSIKLKISIFILLICSLSSFCQEYSISGLILDSTTNLPIPYSTVEIIGKGKGTVSNSSAIFSFSFTSDNNSDTLLFKALGYYDKSIQIQKIQFDSINTIPLKPKMYSLREVSISPQSDVSKTTIRGNYCKKTKSCFYMQNWMQIAVYIENDDNSCEIIDNVSFYIFKPGKTRTPFRIRIYAVDSISGYPGDDLLKDNLIVKPKKKGWFAKPQHQPVFQVRISTSPHFTPSGYRIYYNNIIRI